VVSLNLAHPVVLGLSLRLVRKTSVAGQLSTPLIHLPGLSRVKNSLLTYFNQLARYSIMYIGLFKVIIRRHNQGRPTNLFTLRLPYQLTDALRSARSQSSSYL